MTSKKRAEQSPPPRPRRVDGAVERAIDRIADELHGYLLRVGEEMEAAEPLSGHRRREVLGEVLLASRRAADLMRYLRQLGRAKGSGNHRLALHSRLRRLEPRAREAVGEGIELALDFDSAVGSVMADPVRFEAAVMELLLDARETIDGRGRILLSTAIAPRAGVPGFALAVEADADLGRDLRERVLDPALAGEAARTRILGLTRVRDWLSAGAGELRFSRQPGLRASFELWLPAAVPETRSALTAVAVPTPTSRSVLVVEGNEVIRGLLGRVAESLGHRVVAAADASEAIRRLEDDTERVDLLLCDGEPEGYDVLELVGRAQAIRPALATIVMCREPSERPALRKFTLLPRPFRIAELKHLLVEAMGDKALPRARPGRGGR